MHILPDQDCFIPFKQSIAAIEIPLILNSPFGTSIDPLTAIAVEELKENISQNKLWLAELGIGHDGGQGKMFGVLVVKNKLGKLGYLSAFSGKFSNSNYHKYFVPPLFDNLLENGFYKIGEAELNVYNQLIQSLELDETFLNLKKQLHTAQKEYDFRIHDMRMQHKQKKIERDVKRKEIHLLPDENSRTKLLEQLKNESSHLHFQLTSQTKKWKIDIAKIQDSITTHEMKIEDMKKVRKEKSSALQEKLFSHYFFINQSGDCKNIMEIFKSYNGDMPPAGAGECAAPKLFQYAFKHHLIPLGIAEFWWGKSPASEARRHDVFYGSCKGKCEPILNFMLSATPVESFAITDNSNSPQEIEIVYEDDHLAIVNKPHEFLSVPGKKTKDSVYQRMRDKYPNAKGPIIIHRLDMSTSGLMIIAKTPFAYHHIQSQFIKRKIEKHYIAILDGEVKMDAGTIDLPIRVDLDDRPRQLVCYEYGKPAKTMYEVIERKDGKTKVLFKPITGRTHQLRVHAAHSLGLNVPILGDDLYGKIGERLHLQAQSIQFIHPATNEVVKFELAHDF